MVPSTIAAVMAVVLGQGAASIVTSDGASVFYVEAGAGRAVILLAGGPGFTPDYVKPLCEHLAKSSRCVLLHQRGTGLSMKAASAPDGLRLRTFISDIEAVRQALRQDRIILMGHSWGGMLAMAYAVAHPDRTQRSF